MNDDDFLLMDDEEEVATAVTEPWHILIVDDEPDVHLATEFSLKTLVVGGRGLKFFSAHSAQEAISFLGEHSDIDLVLLDMVMEQPTSGFQVANWLREIAKRVSLPTIVLRSGQPGALSHDDVRKNPHIDTFIEKQHASRAVLAGLLEKYLLRA